MVKTSKKPATSTVRPTKSQAPVKKVVTGKKATSTKSVNAVKSASSTKTLKPTVAKKPLPTKTITKKPSAQSSQSSKTSSAKKSAIKKPAIKKPKPPAINLKPILGISTDLGVLVAVATPPQSPVLSDFRLAVKEPYPRAVNAVKSKCRLSSAVIFDEPTKSDRTVYLAFIPVPSGAALSGQVLYRAKPEGSDEVFFTAGTQVLSKVEAAHLAKILMVLEKVFTPILPDVFGADHELTKTFDALLEKKRETEFWNSTQSKVSALLQEGQGPQALSLLEPLVFQPNPHAKAEKLLGEILWRASLKEKPNQPQDEASQSLATERLLLNYLLSRIFEH